MLEEEIGVNEKPSLIKRLTCDGFDTVCLFILVIILSIVIESTGIAATYKNHVANYTAIEQEVLKNSDVDKINEILLNDKVYQDEVFAANLHSYILKLLEGFIAEIILFLVIPLMNKDGVSLGKLLTGVMLFDESRQRKINSGQILLRFIFIYIVSAMVYPWTGIYSFVFVLVLRFIVLILNKKNKTLCDYLTSTMYIEKLTYSSFD